MWDFSNSSMTFDNPLYLFDGSSPSTAPSPPSTGPPIYGGRVILPAKKQGETVILTFDFISKLQYTPANEIIVSASASCVVYTGVDPLPQNVISGTPFTSGTVVSQLVTGGVVGVIYEIEMSVATSAGQVLILNGYLAILPNYP